MSVWSIFVRACPFRILNSIQIRQKSSLRRSYKGPNAGINRRLKAFSPETDDDIEDIDDLEADFMTVNRQHVAHEREQQEQKEKIQLRMVGRKYFKAPKEPSLLTWEEQEQIRYLHESDPEEWSVEKLTLSFPATETVIKKILRTQWRPSSPERISKYNENVLNNWELLKKGMLDVSEDVKAHLLKFASQRISLPPPPADSLKKTPMRIQGGSTEFSDIIKSYHALKPEKNNAASEITVVKTSSSIPAASSGDSFLLPSGKYGRRDPVTLDKYRKDIIHSVNTGQTPSEEDKVILLSLKTDDVRNKDTDYPEVVERSRLLESKMTTQNSVELLKSKTATLSETKPLPEWIKVPRKYRGKGNLFRIDDTYYDEDGEFLYRVPGMKG